MIQREASYSEYLEYGIDKSIPIHEGRFVLQNDSLTIRVRGRVYYKIRYPSSIRFEGEPLDSEQLDNADMGIMKGLTIDVHGYQGASCVITAFDRESIEGYIDTDYIRSKNKTAEYFTFDISNFDFMHGRMVGHFDKVYSGGIELEYNGYTITIDKRYDFRKELYEELSNKMGSVITHTGRITRKDNREIKSSAIIPILDRIALALSLMSARRIQCINCFGYNGENKDFRMWNSTVNSQFKSIPTWTSTISNPNNLEKFISLILKITESQYYLSSLNDILSWYIESMEGMSLASNLVAVQTTLEMLSYIILVEHDKVMTEEEFDLQSASKNIKSLLEHCRIDFDLEREFLSEGIRRTAQSNVDLLVVLRNRIIHPRNRADNIEFEFDDIWNLLLLGTTYIELALLYLVGYRGEYSNRFLSFGFGEVENTPWSRPDSFI